MSHIRYHEASGHIDLKFSAPAEALSVYAKEGYALLETGENHASSYVVGGELEPRTLFPVPKGMFNAGLGETITITGLPEDAWLTIDGNAPVQTSNGAITIQPPTDNYILVELVGKYMGGLIHLNWSELGALKTKAKNVIDNRAEAARMRVVTTGAGQAMTYMRKAEAARLFLAGATLTDAQTLRLQDEADRLAITVEAAATQIAMIADQWEAIDAQIDSVRLLSKAAVEAAETGIDVDAIVGGIVWPV